MLSSGAAGGEAGGAAGGEAGGAADVAAGGAAGEAASGAAGGAAGEEASGAADTSTLPEKPIAEEEIILMTEIVAPLVWVTYPPPESIL